MKNKNNSKEKSHISRRTFISRTAAGTAVIALGPVTTLIANDMRISIVRSAVYAHHNPRVLDMKAERLWIDQGIQTFRMLLVPHKETWKKSNIVRIAEEFIAPTVTIYQGIHGGSLSKSGSFLAVDAQNIIVSAIKQAENSEDMILRCFETVGLPVEATLDLRFADRKWKCIFRPDEIKTLRINLKSGDIMEVNLLEEHMA
jgi:alpha-mannosidase